jgi:hypothetical protein
MQAFVEEFENATSTLTINAAKKLSPIGESKLLGVSYTIHHVSSSFISQVYSA